MPSYKGFLSFYLFLQAIRHHHTNPGAKSAKHYHHHKLMLDGITDFLETRRLSGFCNLITEFADVTEEPQGLPPYRGHLDHKVKLTSYPPRQRRNILSVHEYEELKRQCTELFKEGKVRISKSPYAAPIVMARKSDGSSRVCTDYRAINERTVKDSFALPRIDDLIDQLKCATCITHLDLRSAYNQDKT